MTGKTNGEDGSGELLELLGALLNNTITPAEKARLERLLLQAAARRLYRRYVNLHAALRLYHAPAIDLLPPADVEAREQDDRPAEVPRRGSEQAAGRNPQRAGRSRVQRLLTLAAGVLILVGLSWLGSGNQRMPLPNLLGASVVGTLVNIRGPIQVQGVKGKRKAVKGMALYARDTLVVPADASAVVTLAEFVRVEVGPETTLAFSAPQGAAAGRALYLKSGFLAVEAGRQPPGQPLRLFTPDARAEVLGTKFTLAAAPRQTRLRVDEGAVKLWSEPAGPGVVVPTGFGSGVANGEAMPLQPSQSGEVLLVEALENVGGRDQWVRFNREMASRLLSKHVRQLALKAVIKSHRDVRASDLRGRPLVIVSVAEENIGFEENLRRIGLAEAAVPVICLEPIAFPVLGMTGSKRGMDFEWKAPSAMVRFLLPDHPLSSGQSGVMRLPVSFAWGRPSDEALRIASHTDHPERAVLFAYETGKRMIGRTAPARRVALLLNPVIVNKPDARSWSLFEAAVNWCVEPAARRQAAAGD